MIVPAAQGVCICSGVRTASLAPASVLLELQPMPLERPATSTVTDRNVFLSRGRSCALTYPIVKTQRRQGTLTLLPGELGEVNPWPGSSADLA